MAGSDDEDAYGAAERGRKSRTQSGSETSERLGRRESGVQSPTKTIDRDQRESRLRTLPSVLPVDPTQAMLVPDPLQRLTRRARGTLHGKR